MTENKQSKPTSSFIAYTSYIKEELGRQLTTKEYSEVMQCYIHGKSADLCVDKLKKGEKK